MIGNSKSIPILIGSTQIISNSSAFIEQIQTDTSTTLTLVSNDSIPFVGKKGDAFDVMSVLSGSNSIGQGFFKFLDYDTAAKLRLVCRNFKEEIEKAFWFDMSTNYTRSITKWRTCFPNAKSVYLSSRVRVTPTDFPYLKGLTTIHLYDCMELTDEAFPYLSGIKDLKIRRCANVTDKALVHLKEIETLDISECYKITGATFSSLKSIKRLQMYHCPLIPDEAFKHLEQLEYLNATSNLQITDAGLRHLKNIKILNLTYCRQSAITVETLEKLKPQKLYVDGSKHQIISAIGRLDFNSTSVEDIVKLIENVDQLWINAMSGHRHESPLLSASYRSFDVVKALILRGADIHAKDSGGWPVLHTACANKDAIDVLTLLLEHGIDINSTNHVGSTALDHAYESKKSQTIIDFLIKNGARFNFFSDKFPELKLEGWKYIPFSGDD